VRLDDATHSAAVETLDEQSVLWALLNPAEHLLDICNGKEAAGSRSHGRQFALRIAGGLMLTRRSEHSPAPFSTVMIMICKRSLTR
jgi:hypothetical protein